MPLELVILGSQRTRPKGGPSNYLPSAGLAGRPGLLWSALFRRPGLTHDARHGARVARGHHVVLVHLGPDPGAFNAEKSLVLTIFSPICGTTTVMVEAKMRQIFVAESVSGALCLAPRNEIARSAGAYRAAGPCEFVEPRDASLTTC